MFLASEMLIPVLFATKTDLDILFTGVAPASTVGGERLTRRITALINVRASQ